MMLSLKGARDNCATWSNLSHQVPTDLLALDPAMPLPLESELGTCETENMKEHQQLH